MNQVRHKSVNSTSGRFEINITPLERLGRIGIGLVGVIAGIILLAGSPTLLTGTLEVLLVAAGLDLLVTGATGHCPLYKKLGYSPKSLKGDGHEPGTSAPNSDQACH